MSDTVGRIELELGIMKDQLKEEILNEVGKVKEPTKSLGLGIGKALGIALSVGAVLKFGKSCTSLASDIAEVQNVVDTAFGSMAYKCEDFASTAIENFGMSETSAKKTASTYMAMGKSMGLSMDSASDMAIEMAKLTGDVSSFYNISQDLASIKLKGVWTGETEALKDLGVVMTQENLQQYAYTQGINKSINAMTQAEKVSLRYKYVMNSLSDTQGDFAKTSDSWANQTRILSENFKRLQAALGTALIQVLQPCVKWLNNIISALTVTAQKFANFITVITGKKIKMGDIITGVDKVSDNISSIGSEAQKAGKKLKDSFSSGIDELNIISSSASDAGDSLGSVGGVSSSSIESDVTEESGGIEGLDASAEKFRTRLNTILAVATTVGTVMLGWKITDGIFKAVDKLKKKIADLTKAQTITIGATLVITGIILEASGIKDAFQNGLDGFNIGEIILGGSLITIGGAIIGKALGKSILGGAIGGIVAGVPMFAIAVYDAFKNGLNIANGSLIALGSTMTGAAIGFLIGGPLGAALGAAIGLAIGLLTDFGIWLYQHWDEVKLACINFFTVTIPNVWTTFTNWLSQLPYTIGYMLGELLATLVLWAIDLSNKMTTFFTVTIPAKFNELSNKISTFFKVTIPAKFDELMQFFSEFPSKLREIGKNIIDGLCNGITEGWKNFWNGWNNLIDGFVDGFKNKLGIHSPSKVFAEMGGYITDGLEEGIGDGNGAFDGLNVLSEERVDSIMKKWGPIAEWFKNNVLRTMSENCTQFAQNMTVIFEGITSMIKGQILLAINMMNIMIESLEIAMDDVVSSVNRIIRSINATSKETGISLPYARSESLASIPIPRLARGGLATAPTLAMVGDNRNANIDPEVISPLSKLKGMINESNSNEEVVRVLLDILEAIKNKETTLNLDSRKIAEAVNKVNENKGASILGGAWA